VAATRTEATLADGQAEHRGRGAGGGWVGRQVRRRAHARRPQGEPVPVRQMTLARRSARWGAALAALAAAGFIGAPAAQARPATVPPTTLTVGTSHACAVRGGAAYCWGQDLYGQLGDGRHGAGTVSSVPVRVSMPDGIAFVGITAGQAHTCAVDTTGGAWCWGRNNIGQLGNGPGVGLVQPDSDVPVAVAGTHTFDSISAGDNHTCALATDYLGWCWGEGSDGQLGNSSNNPSSAPVPLGGLAECEAGAAGEQVAKPSQCGPFFRVIVAGTKHSCGWRTNGYLDCWGADDKSQNGDNSGPSLPEPSNTPKQVYVSNTPLDNGATIKQLAAGGDDTCARVDNSPGGRVACWGSNAQQQITGDSTPTFDVPTQTAGGQSGFDDMSVGGGHSCGLQSGLALCWGDNGDGQLGRQTSGSRDPNPEAVSGSHTFDRLDAGPADTCAGSGGTLWCWGANSSGQAGGAQTAASITVPEKVWLPATAPQNVRVTPMDGKLSVHWDPPADLAGGTLVGYTVTEVPQTGVGTTEAALECTTTGETSCTIGGLTNGQQYRLIVFAGTRFAPDGATVQSDPSAAVDGMPAFAVLAVTGGNGVSIVLSGLSVLLAGVGLLHLRRRRVRFLP
jgi:alpha-tubulin suppressor-like RCC1 family protein